MHNIIPLDYSIHNAAPITTPYYQSIYDTMKKVIHLPGFPQTPKKKIYLFMLPKENSYAEDQFPNFNWGQIWKNFTSTIFIPYEKEVMFKHLHLCLATNLRLARMGRSTTSLCTKCEGEFDQTALHMFYQCENIKPLFLWLLRILSNVCNFKPSSNIKFLYFDTNYSNFYQKSICNIFLYIYILTIWRNRKENIRIGNLKIMVVKKISEYFNFIKLLPNIKLDEILQGISSLDIDNLINL